MKIYEVVNQKFKVDRKTSTEIHLSDPASGVKTIVPVKKDKPGMITKSETGEFELDMDTEGEVDQEVKPGDTVKVNKSNSGFGSFGKFS